MIGKPLIYDFNQNIIKYSIKPQEKKHIKHI